jgi:TIR domain-containing protein
MSSVFISYRRQTAAGEARALFNELVARLGRNAVFMDVDSISLGRDFRGELQKTLAACDLMLVLIDKDWATAKDDGGQIRLENASDFVRMEIEAALKRDIVVTPVLVKGAQMPAAEQLPAEISDLAYRNGFELSHRRWDSDVREMLRRLKLDTPEPGGQAEPDLSALQEKRSATEIPPVPNTRRLIDTPVAIATAPVLPLAQRGPMLRLIVIGAFAIGVLGILAWVAGSLGGHNTIVSGGPCSNTSAGSSSGNSVSCGVVPGSVGTKP